MYERRILIYRGGSCRRIAFLYKVCSKNIGNLRFLKKKNYLFAYNEWKFIYLSSPISLNYDTKWRSVSQNI